MITKEKYLEYVGKTEADFYPGKLDEAVKMLNREVDGLAAMGGPPPPDSLLVQQAKLYANGRTIEPVPTPAPIPTTPVPQPWTKTNLVEWLAEYDDQLTLEQINWLWNWVSLNIKQTTVVLSKPVFELVCKQGYNLWLAEGKPSMVNPQADSIAPAVPTTPTRIEYETTKIAVELTDSEIVLLRAFYYCMKDAEYIIGKILKGIKK